MGGGLAAEVQQRWDPPLIACPLRTAPSRAHSQRTVQLQWERRQRGPAPHAHPAQHQRRLPLLPPRFLVEQRHAPRLPRVQLHWAVLRMGARLLAP